MEQNNHDYLVFEHKGWLTVVIGAVWTLFGLVFSGWSIAAMVYGPKDGSIEGIVVFFVAGVIATVIGLLLGFGYKRVVLDCIHRQIHIIFHMFGFRHVNCLPLTAFRGVGVAKRSHHGVYFYLELRGDTMVGLPGTTEFKQDRASSMALQLAQNLGLSFDDHIRWGQPRLFVK